MNTDKLILEQQKAIVKIYNDQGLTCLSGLGHEFWLNGRNILQWHCDIIGKVAQKNKAFPYTQNMDDIFFCSDELLFFTANLYLYKPYINNPVRDAIPIGDGEIYPNNQNLAGKRYNMVADIASQVAYNFWDRIGDLISSCFPGSLASDRVFFVNALEAVPKQFQANEHFLWLDEFKQRGYQELNKKRKQIVHYSTFDTDFKFEHVKSLHDRRAIERLQEERELTADFYKAHIALTLSGYERANVNSCVKNIFKRRYVTESVSV